LIDLFFFFSLEVLMLLRFVSDLVCGFFVVESGLDLRVDFFLLTDNPRRCRILVNSCLTLYRGVPPIFHGTSALDVFLTASLQSFEKFKTRKKKLIRHFGRTEKLRCTNPTGRILVDTSVELSKTPD
jgi:hypothetical protein